MKLAPKIATFLGYFISSKTCNRLSKVAKMVKK
jgi:hypothetical protein